MEPESQAILSDLGLMVLLQFSNLLGKPLENYHLLYLPGHGAEAFEIEQERFKIWASNVNMFNLGPESLDYNVQKAPQMTDTLRRLLKDLIESFEDIFSLVERQSPQVDEAKTASSRVPELKNPISSYTQPALADYESDSGDETSPKAIEDLQTLYGDVVDAINKLFKTIPILESSLTHPSPKDAQWLKRHVQGAGGSEYELFNQQVEFERGLIESCLKNYDEEIIKPEDHHWPQTSQDHSNRAGLLNKLARCNAVRRMQFTRWRKEYEEKPASEKNDPARLRRMRAEIEHVSKSLGVTDKSATPEIDVEDIFALEHHQPAWPAFRDVVSIRDGFFTCPFCFLDCPEDFLANDTTWRTHLIYDLRPYTCTYWECPSDELFIANRDKWASHERTLHQAHLTCPEHRGEAFTKEGFVDHVKSLHPTNKDELLSREGLSAALTINTANQRTCPLCYVLILSLQKMETHLISHLESLALLSLPHLNDPTAGDLIATQEAKASKSKLGAYTRDTGSEVSKLGSSAYGITLPSNSPPASISSFTMSTSSDILHVPQKRKFTPDSIQNSSSTQRKNADEMRYYGACWRCRRYKKSCNGPGEWDTCRTSGFRVWPSTIGCYRVNMEDFISGVVPANAEMILKDLNPVYTKQPNWRTHFGVQLDTRALQSLIGIEDRYTKLCVKLQSIRIGGQAFIDLFEIMANYQRIQDKPDICLEHTCESLSYCCDIYHAFVLTDSNVAVCQTELLDALTKFRSHQAATYRHFLNLCLSGRRSAWFPASVCVCINMLLLVIFQDSIVVMPEPARSSIWPSITLMVEELRNRLYPMCLGLLSALAKGIKPWRLDCWSSIPESEYQGPPDTPRRDNDGMRFLGGDKSAFDGFFALQEWWKHNFETLQQGVKVLKAAPFTDIAAKTPLIAVLAWVFDGIPPRKEVKDGKLVDKPVSID